MIEKYLLENGERITDPSQLVPGEIYAVGYGVQGFKGFVMPEKERLIENDFEELELRDIEVYSLASKCPGDKPGKEYVDIDFGYITMECLGVIKPYEGSEIRKNIEEGLGVVKERVEEREPAVA